MFLDEQFRRYQDQWAFLPPCGKIAARKLEAIVRDAERRGRIVGVRLAFEEDDEDAMDRAALAPTARNRRSPAPLPKTLELVLGDQIYIAKEDLPPALRNRLLRLAAFQNPEFYRAQAMRLPTYDKPRIIACAEDRPQHIGLPRGCLDEVAGPAHGLWGSGRVSRRAVCRHAAGRAFPRRVAARTGDGGDGDAGARHRRVGRHDGLRQDRDCRVAHRQRGVNTLVLVHRQQLLEQWVERLATFLDVPAKSIGRIGGGRRKLTGRDRRGAHAEPGAEGRGGRLRGGLRPPGGG